MAVSTSPARTDGLPALPGVEHRWLDAPSGGGRVRLHVAQAGSGAPVLLLHGWPQHWWCWRRVIERLGGDYRLVVPDLRGFGWSEAPGTGYSAAGFAGDAVGLLDALDLPRAHVIGHDWGGFTGILLGLRHPERVDRLLLCNTPGPWARPTPRTLAGLRRAWYAALVATPVLGERVVADPRFVPWFLRLGGQAELFSDEDATLYADQFRDPARAAAASRLYRYYLQTAQAVLLRHAFAGRRLETPTRLLFGADDVYIPLAILEEIEAHGDDLTLEVVRGCSHWLPEERPDLVADRARALFGPG
jgi:pimeloyl-ACP methyl ester carboxylesterase